MWLEWGLYKKCHRYYSPFSANSILSSFAFHSSLLHFCFHKLFLFILWDYHWTEVAVVILMLLFLYPLCCNLVFNTIFWDAFVIFWFGLFVILLKFVCLHLSVAGRRAPFNTREDWWLCTPSAVVSLGKPLLPIHIWKVTLLDTVFLAVSFYLSVFSILSMLFYSLLAYSFW